MRTRPANGRPDGEAQGGPGKTSETAPWNGGHGIPLLAQQPGSLTGVGQRREPDRPRLERAPRLGLNTACIQPGQQTRVSKPKISPIGADIAQDMGFARNIEGCSEAAITAD